MSGALDLRCGDTATDAALQLREYLAADEAFSSLAQGPASVFVIGSCSEEVIHPSWWQDFDVHFLWNAVDVPDEAIAWMSAFLASARSASTPTCTVDATVRDRHWKMTPDASVENNIGIHATLLSRADHFRRVAYHPILANNMYKRCRVLRGVSPATANGSRRLTPADQMHGVGGLGWLAENFARAVAMEQQDPTDRSFAPFLGGYCWNVVGASLFHLYTLTTGGITGRHVGLAYALDQGLLDAADVESARFVEARRLQPHLDRDEGIECVNAAGRVLHAVGRAFERSMGLADVPAPRPEVGLCAHLVAPGSLTTEILTVRRNERLPYWDGIAAALDEAGSTPVSFREDPEFLYDVVNGGPSTKLRIVDNGSSRRFAMSDDHRPTSLYAAVFGWESGVQALLQRLTEWLVVGRPAAEVDAAADAFVAIASARLDALGVRVDVAGGSPTSTAACRSWLAAQLAPHTPSDLVAP